MGTVLTTRVMVYFWEVILARGPFWHWRIQHTSCTQQPCCLPAFSSCLLLPSWAPWSDLPLCTHFLVCDGWWLRDWVKAVVLSVS
jgi:hypothetical protein